MKVVDVEAREYVFGQPSVGLTGSLVLAASRRSWYVECPSMCVVVADGVVFVRCLLGDLTYAKASHKSMYGRIVSGWKRKGETFRWNITVPPNTTATVYVPAKAAVDVIESGRPTDKSSGVTFLWMARGRAVFSVGSGSYEFASKLETGKKTE